jgi:ATP-dependent RNA helicase DOB1
MVESAFYTTYSAEERHERYANFADRMEIEAQARVLRKEIRATKGMVLKDNLQQMRRVLRRLGCCNQDNVIAIKGRTACEISTANELVITELVFGNTFDTLSVHQIVALLSCMVNQDKVNEEGAPKIADDMAPAYRQLQEAARKVGKVMEESKIEVDVEEFVKGFNPALMDVRNCAC